MVKYRFLKYLDPKVSHEPFTVKEDKLILELNTKNQWNWKQYAK